MNPEKRAMLQKAESTLTDLLHYDDPNTFLELVAKLETLTEETEDSKFFFTCLKESLQLVKESSAYDELLEDAA
jgi:hypothetical protein